MIINGLDTDLLAGHTVSDLPIPEVVPGRVVHIDADFLAYQCSAESETETKSWEDMQHNAQMAVTSLKELAGATAVHLHLTPSTSNKGGRYEIALLKDYQDNRADKAKPRYLTIMREHLSKAYPATMHQLCEADDGMSSEQYAALARGERNLSIIASKDKDLRMVPGLHLNWDTGQIEDSGDDFGYIELDRSKSSPKVVGYGQKFFWAQMLMGDQADNISGLPRLPGVILNKVRPSAPQIKLREQYKLEPDPAKKAKIVDKLKKDLSLRKSVTVGAVLAFDAIDPLKSNAECFEFVKAAYRAYGEEHGFVHYDGIHNILWNKAFVSEAQLLWMRKDKHNPLCVVDFFREILK